MLKRQSSEATLGNPVLREAGIQMLAEACPKEPAETWNLLRTVLPEALDSLDQRLQVAGPLQPNRFDLVESKER